MWRILAAGSGRCDGHGSMDLKVTAVEMDETTAACATMNLIPFPQASVVHSDATSVPLDGVEGVWLDPARRTTSTSGTRR
ncbi:conserved hypothetical protein, partial [Arthrobacter sp. Hiyo6]